MSESDFLRGVLHRSTDAETSLPSLGEIGLNFFVPYLLNRIASSWNSDLAEDLRAHDLTTPQMRVLAVLNINTGLTINELSELTVTEQSTMSRTLDTLEERGLLRRRLRGTDLRVREVDITTAGRKLFTDFWPTMFKHYDDMFKDIGEDEFSALVATLHKVLRNIRRNQSEPVI
jgi:MarR family transcriptional regulator, transcriptional regulator for hemolysin